MPTAPLHAEDRTLTVRRPDDPIQRGFGVGQGNSSESVRSAPPSDEAPDCYAVGQAAFRWSSLIRTAARFHGNSSWMRFTG